MDYKFYDMMESYAYITIITSVLGLIIFFVIVYMIISRLNSLIREQKKTNLLLRKQVEHDKIEITPEEYTMLFK